MTKYKFTGLNSNYSEITFVNPKISVKGNPLPEVYKIDPNKMTISVIIRIESEGFSPIEMELDGIKVDNLNYTPESLEDKFKNRLKNFKI